MRRPLRVRSRAGGRLNVLGGARNFWVGILRHVARAAAAGCVGVGFEGGGDEVGGGGGGGCGIGGGDVSCGKEGLAVCMVTILEKSDGILRLGAR